MDHLNERNTKVVAAAIVAGLLVVAAAIVTITIAYGTSKDSLLRECIHTDRTPVDCRAIVFGGN